MSNPFHSFHVQSGGVRLHKLSTHYRNKNKSNKFQPLMLQENKDLVVPMDLLHVPPHSYHCAQTPHHNNDYYIYPETQQYQPQSPLEIVQIHIQPQPYEYTPYPVLDDEHFDQMFLNVSTTPKSRKTSNKTSRKSSHKKSKNIKKRNSKRTLKQSKKTPK